MKPGDEIRRRADAIEASAREQLARAEELRRLADQSDALSGESVDPVRLTIAPVESTVETNMQPTSLNIGRGKSAALRDGHPFAVALYARGLTVKAWATKHRVSVPTASSWLSTSPAGRRKIPARWARRIEIELGLPANETTWPNGITD